MFRLTRKAEEIGLKLVIETDVANRAAEFVFKDGDHTLAKHPDVFAASVWLDGYVRGGHRERHMDRSVC